MRPKALLLCLLLPFSFANAGVSLGLNNLAETYVGYEWNSRWGVAFCLPFPHLTYQLRTDRNRSNSNSADSTVWQKDGSGDLEIGNDWGTNTSLEMYRIANYADFDGEVNLKIWSLRPSLFLTENVFSLCFAFSKSYGGLRFYAGPLIGLKLHEEYVTSDNGRPWSRTRTLSLVKSASYGLRYTF
jgi:hypothetical protein